MTLIERLIVVVIILWVSPSRGETSPSFHLDEHLRQHKDHSPVLSSLLKKGRLSKRDPERHHVSRKSPPTSPAREKAAHMLDSSPVSELKAKGVSYIYPKGRNADFPHLSLSKQKNSNHLTTSKIPGDVYYFYGTLLDLEYVACEDGDLNDNLSKEQENQLVSAKGYALGECNPYEPSWGLSTVLTATVNIFLETMILHEVSYEHANCTGTNVTTHTEYPGSSSCVGDSKLFVTTSMTLHEQFDLLKDKMFALRTSQECTDRENLLYFVMHNTSYSFYNSDMCWTHDQYTLSIEEGDVYDPLFETTIVTKEFEPFDDKTCRHQPVLIEGWVIDKCEPLTEHTGTKAVWTSVGEKDGNFYIGVQSYDTYDCDRNMSMTGTSVLNMGKPDTCYHNVPVPWMINENVKASWSDYGFDSHSELYGGQVCNNEHIFMWKTAQTECTKDTKTDFEQCLTYNHFAEDDMDDVLNDDFAIELKSQEIYCHANSGSEDDAICFHIDTIINYKGTEYTYEELMDGQEPECSVPHSPTSKGVVISTSCSKTLRVTDTHLIATSKGFKLAYSLKPGDIVFSGFHNTEQCEVISVEKESVAQQYFGLNCVHSEVLASGIRSSTFGDFHTIPSWYMHYIGSLAGVDYASRLGDFIVAEWYRP